MPSPIRPADWEHFSIVRESLSLDRLHVAMVGRTRRQLLDYAAGLAITLSEQDSWHVEKYDPQRLENLIVDLMLNRFDTALQTVSGHRTSPSRPVHPGRNDDTSRHFPATGQTRGRYARQPATVGGAFPLRQPGLRRPHCHNG